MILPSFGVVQLQRQPQQRFFQIQVHDGRQARHGLQAVQLADGDVLGRRSRRNHERRNPEVSCWS